MDQYFHHLTESLPPAFTCIGRHRPSIEPTPCKAIATISQGRQGSRNARYIRSPPAQNVRHGYSESDQTVIKRKCRYYGLISLAPFLEFGHIKASVFVLIHHPEYLPYPLLGSIFVFWQLDHRTNLFSKHQSKFCHALSPGAYHLIYRFYDLQHLFIANLAIAIDIIELESPVQLVLHLASACDTKRTDEFFEVDGAAVVRIEDLKDVIRK